EIFFHEVFVHLDDLVENGGMAALHSVEIRFAGGVEQAFHDGLSAAGGEVDRKAFGAEGFADVVDEGFEVDFRGVDLVDDDRAGEVSFAGGFHHAAGDDFDAGHRV